jgi:hypothetical protein
MFVRLFIFLEIDSNKDGKVTLDEFVLIAKNANQFPIVNFLL